MGKRREKGLGSIYADSRHPGRYIGEVTINGKRRRVSGKDKTEVRAKLRALVAKRETGRPIGDQRATVADAIDQFLERDLPNRRSNGRPLAPGTVNNYRTYLDTARAEIGKTKLANLTVGGVEQMLDRLADRGYTYASLTKLRSMLATVVTFAERRDLVHRNVVKLATIPPTAKRSDRRRALSPDHARRLLTQLRTERNGAMYGMSLLLGLRPGEAAALHWRDVDLEAGVVNVTRGLQRDGGKVSVVDNLKTEGSKRTIEMSPDLVTWLAEHRRDQLEERVAASSWADDKLVFATARGTVVDPSNSRAQLTAICERAEVPVVRPVELRHSCASLLADRGVPNEAIADLLGHTTTRMVDATYRHRLRPVVDVAARADWLNQSSS